ncbi:hypothetical protein ACLKMH_14135 [Psychromonas sp. KJ10-10]|uniref:hypothetical protein n=1 Tax=Psychromonas sp. KJ10-10 TaxID=3391823 RepID=UPI0039B43A93
MINDVLNCVKQLKAIDRFIFLGMLFHNKPYINGNRKQLVTDYGFSEAVIERTLSKLVEAGFLEKQIEPQKAGQRGRPSFQYKNIILGKINKELNATLNLQIIFSNEKIKNLLLSAFNEDKNDDLKADSKLLLIVLLHHADKFGFVENLDNATLLKLTGMKQQALEGQIQRLIDLGYICSKVSGINNKYLFGRKSSVFILNMQHISFKDCSEANTTFLYFKHPDSLIYKPGYQLSGKQRFINFSAPGTFEAQKLILLSIEMETLNNDRSISEEQRKQNWESRSLYSEVMQLIDYQHFKDIALFFVTKSNPETFATYLQFKLNQYASKLLSQNVYLANTDNKLIKQAISHDIFHPKLDMAIVEQVAFNEKMFTEIHKKSVVDLIYGLCLMIARDISKIITAQNLPESLCDKSCGDSVEVHKRQLMLTNFRILPPLKRDFRYLAISSDYPVRQEKSYFIYGDTIVKKYQLDDSLVGEQVLLKVEEDFSYKTFIYGSDESLNSAKKLLQTIESRFLEARSTLPEAQLFCFSLHQHPGVKYSSHDGQGWLLPPKHMSELAQ